MNAKEDIIKNEIQKIVDKIAERGITSNVFLSPRQLDILSQLNNFSTNKILGDPEVEKDPRKIAYKTNEELRFALIALCLSIALTDHRSKSKYTKEYFANNIYVETTNNDVVNLIFEDIDERLVEKAINPELIFDWMVYRDNEGRGIYALFNEKMNGLELDTYTPGGDDIYEFARFQRKYHDFRRKKETLSKDSAQEAFRNAVAQQVANHITAQQLLSGKDPMELVNLLFGKPDYEASIDEIVKALGKNPNAPLKITQNNLQIPYKKNKRKKKKIKSA